MPKRPSPDSRLAAARYGIDGSTPPDAAAGADAGADPSDRGQPTLDQRAQFVEIAIQQAMRRGDFDGLPGAGQPLADPSAVRDPDWWIRRKIQREGLTGLAPPALTLRTEDAGLNDRLDALTTEVAVREVIVAFNTRVREARRQLLGGPPVVTSPRDVEAEIAAWRQRADARRLDQARALEAARRGEAAELAAMTWRERRRARRRPARG